MSRFNRSRGRQGRRSTGRRSKRRTIKTYHVARGGIRL